MNVTLPSSRIQSFLLIFLPCAMVFLMFGAGLALQQKTAWLNEIEQHESNLVRLQKQLFETAIGDQFLDAITLASVARMALRQGEAGGGGAARLSELFLSYAENKQVCDQVRFIDRNGWERVRVDYAPSEKGVVVPESQLQFKGDRYYFRRGMGCGDALYVSPFDLNIEHGEVEKPFKPMIRITCPVQDARGEAEGLVVLNLLGNTIIDLMDRAAANAKGDIYLVNDQGHWLKGPSPEVEWQFMFREDVSDSMASAYPDAWRRRPATGQRQVRTDAGLFTLGVILPEAVGSHAGQRVSETVGEESWLIVSWVSSQALQPGWWTLAMVVLAAGVAVIGVFSYYLAGIQIRRGTDMRQLAEHERRLNTITQSAMDAIIMLDASGRATFWNPAAERIFGIKAEEIIGKFIHSLIIPKEKSARAASGIKYFGDTGEGFVLDRLQEVEAVRKDGSTFPAELNINAVRLDGDWCAVGVLRDITEKKLVENALKKSQKELEQRVAERTKELKTANDVLEMKIRELQAAEFELKKLSMAIEQSPSTVVITDLNGTIEYANPSFARVTGYTIEEALGKNPSIMKSGIHQPDLYRDLWETITSGQAWFGEICNRRKNGELYWELVSISPVKNLQGEVTHYVAVKEDITDRKRKEAELQKAKELAEIANRAKSDFLANMSHEIRTPLNAIIGMTHLALKTQLDAKQLDYLQKIDISAQSLLDVLSDILDFSKIEAGRMELEHTAFSLATLIHRVGNIFGVKIIEKGLQFHVNVADDVPLELIGDPLRLTQVLSNLVGNAVKFTDAGEISLDVTCQEAGNETVRLQFQVCDTGIGIEQKAKENLFQAFSQEDTSTTRRFGGTGLGLAITRKIVGMMGGEIWVESEPGVGSRFYFTAEFRSDEDGSSAALSNAVKDLRILVVEDEEHLGYLIRNILSVAGLIPTLAGTGEEALRILENEPPGASFHAYLVDWKLGGKWNGTQLISRIKQDPASWGGARFILMSGYLSREIQQAVDDGLVDLFLPKPLTAASLTNGLRKLFLPAADDGAAENRGAPPRSGMAPIPVGARILLVEDNELNQQVASEILRGSGFDVTIADNGRAALERLDREPVDAVLMDVQMPVMDGYTAAEEIRKDERFRRLPIIAMSAFAIEAERQKSLSVGMNDFVSKPFQAEALVETLVKWLEPEASDAASTDAGPLPRAGAGKAHGVPLPPMEAPGIAMEESLRNLGGNMSLYLDLLKSFDRSFSRTAEEIEDALLAGERPLARRLAHTVKGVAGNIGATALQASAGHLEAAVLQEDASAVQARLAAFRADLQSAFTGIRHVLRQHERGGDPEKETGDIRELRRLLSELEVHVQKRGAMQCAQVMEKILSMSWPSHIDPSVQRLSRSVETFQFKDAQAHLLSLMEALDREKGESHG